MRIVTGIARGRNILPPKNVQLRPTSDRVRQALYNALGPLIQNARVLDLFCGSGAVGLEALSRGANKVVFVDVDHRCVENAVAHAQKFKFGSEYYDHLNSDALIALQVLIARGAIFDIIYVDPPYASASIEAVLRVIASSSILAPQAIVVVETARGAVLPKVAGLQLGKSYEHGDSILVFYHAGANG